MHNKKVSLLLLGCGFWLIAAPLTFAYADEIMAASDILTGLILVFFGLLSAIHFFKIYAFIFFLIGLWLGLSPLVFWALQPQAYVNDTILGFITLATAFRFSGMQGRGEDHPAGAPMGWSFNPSAWLPRALALFAALLCWFISRYLASYQMGYTHFIWDPVFHREALQVLTSSFAKKMPISIAGLGAFFFSLIVLLGFQGNSQRWRTMPWIVLLNAVIIISMGILSILIVVLQPIFIGAWCGLCLILALLVIALIVLGCSEIAATCQYIWHYKKSPFSLWKLFWKGIPDENLMNAKTNSWGVSLSFRQLTVIGLGLAAALVPYFLGSSEPQNVINYIAGPLIVAFASLSIAEILRPIRLLNVLVSLYLLVAPWVTHELNISLILANTALSILIILLTIIREPVKNKYGSLSQFLF